MPIVLRTVRIESGSNPEFTAFVIDGLMLRDQLFEGTFERTDEVVSCDLGRPTYVYKPIGPLTFIGIYGGIPEYPDEFWKEEQTDRYPVQTILNGLTAHQQVYGNDRARHT
jgi:hypothetical protein